MNFLESEFTGTDEAEALLHIIPVPLEATVSWGGGTAHGPSAILEASQELEAWDGAGIPGKAGFFTAAPVPCASSREEYSLAIQQAAERVLSFAPSRSLKERRIPVTLGGEHSLTLPVMRAIKAHYKESAVGIIQFDAHADLRDQLGGNPYSHGCVMRRIYEELGLAIMQLGTRALCTEEIAYRGKNAIAHIDARELIEQNIREAPLPPDFPPLVYISFDLDALDPAIMPATGTPVPGGLFWYQTLALLESVAKQRAIIGMDMVELAPIAGFPAPSFLAADLIHKMMGMAVRNY
ncbi:MAG: agmatinase [Spirochaetota bacterium]|nr:agmatinase [Spirochaetota bacterium]